MNVEGKMIRAHRLAWKIFYGKMPKLWVLHKCDNPFCCKKDHLFLGTREDNIADMLRKNRQARGSKITANRHTLAGEEHPCAVLTNMEINTIRKTYSLGKHSYMDLSRMFKVTKQNIALIIARRTWRSV